MGILAECCYGTSVVSGSTVSRLLEAFEDHLITFEMDIKSELTAVALSKLSSSDVTHDLDTYLDSYRATCSTILQTSTKLFDQLKQFVTGSNSPSTVLKAVKHTVCQLNDCIGECNVAKTELDIRLDLARTELYSDNGTRCECGIYYHGIFVSINTSLIDEMIPLIRKLTEHLGEKPFYLTPELIKLLEEAA